MFQNPIPFIVTHAHYTRSIDLVDDANNAPATIDGSSNSREGRLFSRTLLGTSEVLPLDSQKAQKSYTTFSAKKTQSTTGHRYIGQHRLAMSRR